MSGSVQGVSGVRGLRRRVLLTVAILLGAGCGRVENDGPAADGSVPPDGAGLPDGAALPDGNLRVADSLRDFAATQGAGGWEYLYQEPPSAVLKELVYADGTWAVDQTRFWTSLWDSGGHPNIGGRPGKGNNIVQMPVRRWISDAAGSATIAYKAARNHPVICGDGVLVRGIVDDVVRWEQALPGDADGTPVEGVLSTTLGLGSTVDLAVDSLITDGCDSTFFTAIITVTGD